MQAVAATVIPSIGNDTQTVEAPLQITMEKQILQRSVAVGSFGALVRIVDADDHDSCLHWRQGLLGLGGEAILSSCALKGYNHLSWWTILPWKNGSWQILHSSSGKCLGAGGRSPLVSLPRILLNRALAVGQDLPRSLQLLPCAQSSSAGPHGASTVWRITSSRHLLLVRSASSSPSPSWCLQRSWAASAAGPERGRAGARLGLGDCLSSEILAEGNGTASSWRPLQVSWTAQVTRNMASPSPGDSDARRIQLETFEHVAPMEDASY